MIGVLASFDARDALLRGIDDAKGESARPPTVFLPAYDRGVVAAVHAQRSIVPAWTLAGGVAGGVLGFGFLVWTARQWRVLMLGGKPLVALPPFLVIVFELVVLAAAIAAVAAFLLGTHRARRGVALAYDPSFSNGHFGLLVACGIERADEVGDRMTRCGATTWRIV
jgi:hypothetical protein